MKGVPYARATGGGRVREEIVSLLRRFGCDSIGFLDKFGEKKLVLGFDYRGRSIRLEASAAGWAKLYLKANPWHDQRKSSRAEWEEKALEQGLRAAPSILRDWLKGQLTAVEAGILSFDNVFMPFMITERGETVAERVGRGDVNLMLPPPGTDE